MGAGRCGKEATPMASSVLEIWRIGPKRMGQKGPSRRKEGAEGLVPLALRCPCAGASAGAQHGMVQSTFAGGLGVGLGGNSQ